MADDSSGAATASTAPDPARVSEPESNPVTTLGAQIVHQATSPAAPPVTDPAEPAFTEHIGLGSDAPATSAAGSTTGTPAVFDGGVAQQPAPQWRTAPPSSVVPARRPRRTPSRPFTPNQSQQRRDDRMRELVEKAPRYAALLQSYAVAQSGKEAYKSRNIQLYGLTAQELADRIAVDKAVMTAANLPTPRFTNAHYIDAVLDEALRALNPQGKKDSLETERDIVWELAQDGLAYRDYVTSDPQIEAMNKPRSQCPLRVAVNQRYDRMMTILRTMPELKAQPFEIVSACVAKYLNGLEAEQSAFEDFWDRNLISSYE
jgi:hypothetical protein